MQIWKRCCIDSFDTGNYDKKLYAVTDGTILFKTNDGDWSWDICNFTEGEFVKSRLADPGSGIKLLNIAKKDKDSAKNVSTKEVEEPTENGYFL